MSACRAAAAALTALVLAGSTPYSQSSTEVVAASGATLVGVVYDSLYGRPLAGAMVQLVPNGSRPGPMRAVETDSLGTFRFAGLQADSYIIGFLHPAVDALGLREPSWNVQVTGDSTQYVMLSLPSAAGIRREFCAAPSEHDSTGMLLGIVRDPDTGVPLMGATVVLLWNEIIIDKRGLRPEQQRFPGKSNADGRYVFCSLPTEIALTARAELGDRSSGYVELWIPPRGLLQRDFAIPSDSASSIMTISSPTDPEVESLRRGTARLTGRALDPNGQPVLGAQVTVLGSASRGTSESDGTFTLAGLPAGTQMLEARALGYEPRRVAVDLVSGQTAAATVQFTTQVRELESVVVYGRKSRRLSDLETFESRRRHGQGRYFAVEDIDRRKPPQLSDLFRDLAGMRVERTGAFNTSIWMRGPGGYCKPAVYIDRVLLANSNDVDVMVNPDEIYGVEVYSFGSAPSEYVRPGDHCGAILIWLGTGRKNAKDQKGKR